MHFKFLKTLQQDKLLIDLRYQGEQSIDLALPLLEFKELAEHKNLQEKALVASAVVFVVVVVVASSALSLLTNTCGA